MVSSGPHVAPVSEVCRAERHGRSAVHRHLLETIAREETDPLAVGREERAHRPFGIRERDRLETVARP